MTERDTRRTVRRRHPDRAAGTAWVTAPTGGAEVADATAPTMVRPFSRGRLVPGILPAALLGGLALACGVALTTTSGWLIVAASYHPQILTLLAAIVLVRAFGIARPALRYAERIRSHDAALASLAEERAATYARLVPLTPARLGRRSRGDVLAGVVDDLDDIAYAQVRVVVPMVALLVSGLLAAFANALILLPAAAVTLSDLICTLLVARLGYAAERRAQGAVVEARAEVARLTTLITDNAPELAAIGADRQALGWLRTAQDALTGAVARQGRGRALGVAAMPLVTLAHTAVMAAVVAYWSRAGLPAPLGAFLVLTPVALGEVVAAVPDAAGALARARSAGRRLDRLLGQRPAVKPTPTLGLDESPAELPNGTAAPDLTFHRVTASWDGDRAALVRLNARVKPGDRVGVVGPNGSGKSTVLAVLARHLDPASGMYAMDAVDVLRIPLAEARGLLAVVDDEPHVFASTLRENLRFARPEASDAELTRALALAGLGAWYAALPGGLDTPLGATGQGVSGGERARLAVARALLSQRPVLLLDEPVAHLDRPTALAVLRDLWEASSGRSVVLVAHREEGLDDVDTLLRLGPPEDAPPPPVAGPR